MKKLSGLVIILAVLVLGGYYGMGIVTEKTIKKNMDVINQSNGLHAELEHYKRGFFDSNANIKWSLHIPERVIKGADGNTQTIAAQDFKFDMPIKIYHGPFIFADHRVRFGMGYASSEVTLPKDLADQFNQAFAKDSVQPKLDLSIAVSYLNNSTLGLSVPMFKLVDKDGHSSLDWMGMESSTSMSSHLDKINGTIDFDGMNMVKDDVKLSLGKVSSYYNLHETAGGLYLGEANLDVPELSVTSKDKKLFDMKELSISSRSDISNQLFSTNLDISLSSIWANEKSYGPAELALALKNLDADVLAKINQQASAMQKGTDAEKQQAMLMMLPELPKLFNKGAELELSKLSVKLPEGTIKGYVSVKLPAGEAANPFQIFQKIDGDATLEVPVEVVKLIMQQTVAQQAQTSEQDAQLPEGTSKEDAVKTKVDKQLAALQESGLIKLDGTNYTIEAHLKDGKVTVNGKPFDPSMMKLN